MGIKDTHRNQPNHTIAMVAHCVLNQNSRASGSVKSGMLNEIIEVLWRNNIGVIQMPCPELTYTGLRRKKKTRKQYDKPDYRRHCKRIASNLVVQIQEYLDNDFKVRVILGIDGSPSCGVKRLLCNESDGGIRSPVPCPTTQDSGIFIEELERELKERKITIPIEGLHVKTLTVDARRLEEIFSGDSKHTSTNS